MRTLQATLTGYIRLNTALGSSGTDRPDAELAELRRVARAQLLDQLRDDEASCRGLLLLWGGFAFALFVGLLAILLSHAVDPRIGAPTASVALFAVLFRVERIWREMRLQTLALKLAFLTEGDTKLVEVMTLLYGALMTDAKSARGAPAPRPSRPR